MALAQLIFYILSIMGIFSALMVVFSRNAMYSVLYLILVFVSITLHYLVLLNASFLGIVNIIVYAGAIMVLFLYVIMLLNLNDRAVQNKHVLTKASAILAAIIFVVVLIGAMRGGAAAGANGLYRRYRFCKKSRQGAVLRLHPAF